MHSSLLRLLFVLVAPLIYLLVSFSPTAGSPEGISAPKWQRSLPTLTCPVGDLNCFRASPALADINDDGQLDIIVATFSGRLIALSDNGTADGQILWNVDIGQAVGAGAGNARISSSPAVADIDQNDGGRPEIVVGFGHESIDSSPGGLIVLEHDGTVKNGWPRLSQGTHPNGVPQQIFATPALGDLNGDGDLEIVVGGFDKRLYAYDHTGVLLEGFPPDSYLTGRFPTWQDLRGHLGDMMWSSPALGDLNGDGRLEIVVGTDEGNFDDRWGGDANGWTCPFAQVPGYAPGYCGGSVYAFDASGQLVHGFPKYILEAIQSTPALIDMDRDGHEEVFIGTGAFYYLHSADNPTYGFRLYGLESDGTELPGWSGGQSVSSVTPASPTVGDIDGDGEQEVVIGTLDGRVYAFRMNGQPVPGFPMLARDRFGETKGFDVGQSFILADYDGDPGMEIFFNLRSSTIIVDGDGTQLTTVNNGNDGLPAYGTGGWLINNPAIGDIDGDGKLEMVVHDSTLRVWDLDSDRTDNEWPMWKQNSSRQSRALTPAYLDNVPDSSWVMCQTGEPCSANSRLPARNGGDRPLFWEIDTTNADSRVSFSDIDGTIAPNGLAQISYSINVSGLGDGTHDLGSVEVIGTREDGYPAGSATVDLVFYRGDVYTSYLPVTRNR